MDLRSRSGWLALTLALSFAFTPALAAAQGPKRLRVPADFTTIEEALDTAEKGDIVEVARGVYEETLTIKPGVTLRGKDPRRTIVRGASDAPVLTIFDAHEARIEGITFEHETDPTASGEPGQPALLIEADRVVLEKVRVERARGAGIRIDAGKKLRLEDVVVRNSIGPGLHAKQAEISLSNCSFAFSGQEGVSVLEGCAVQAEKVTCEGNKKSGISVVGAASLKASELTAKLNNVNGIRIAGGTATLQRCEVNANDSHGLFLAKGTAHVIEGIFKGHKKSGMWAEGTLSVTGTRCFENEIGIDVVTKGTRARIEKAICSRNRKNGVLIHAGAFGEVVDSEAEANGNIGIGAADEDTEVAFSGNECRDNKVHGISVARKARGTLTKNLSENNQQQGICVLSEATAKLVRNTSKGNTLNGIQIWDGGVAELERNTCDNNKQNGIEIHGPKSKAKLKKNRCRRNIAYGVRFSHGARSFKIGRDNILSKNKKGSVRNK